MSKIQHKFLGKVLIVDDQLNDPVKNLIYKLTEKGLNVQYWNSKKDFYKSVSNVRILILDLDLTDGVVPRGNQSFFYAPAKVLGQIEGPYIVILYAINYMKSDIADIKLAYKNIYGTPFEGYIEGIDGLPKEKGANELIKIMSSIIDKKDIYKLIISWEKLLDKSIDQGMKKFVREKFENEVKEFVKSLEEDVGTESLPREFVSNMMRFVTRYMHRGSEYMELKKLLETITSNGTSGSISDLLLQNRNMYFTPDQRERIWTGDLFRIKNAKDLCDYAIIITPECDIAQDKVGNYLVCKGFALDLARLKDKKHPIYSIDKKFKIPDRNGMSNEQFESKIRGQLNRLKNEHDRYYTIWNYSEEEGKYFGLCFDFQNIQSIDKDKFKKKFGRMRTSRLDMPFITEFVQKYSYFTTRLGVPPINNSHIQTN